MKEEIAIVQAPSNELVKDLKSKIDFKDSTSILSYGASAQRKSTEFANGVLESTRTKDFNETGAMLTDLVAEIKSFDANSSEKNFIMRLFSSYKNKLQRLQSSYSSAANNIDKIVEGLEKHRRTLLQDIALLDTLYTRNLEYLDELEVYIIAGNEKINEMHEVELPNLKVKAESSNDPILIQEYRDLTDTVNRFEKKVHDLKLTKAVSLQLLPQIKLQQANNSILVDKIHSSIVNSIPLWKSQMVIALGLAHTHSALTAQKAVTDATNEMLRKNSELLKSATIGTAKESERAIIDIETIRQANNDIVETIIQVNKIQQDAKQKRVESEKELERLGKELKENIMRELV